MGLLTGKRLLISGMLSTDSLAYGIAQACFREGAELAFTYFHDRVEKRVRRLADQFGNTPCFACDVSCDKQIAALPQQLLHRWDGMDGFVHAIAGAPAEAVSGSFLKGLSRDVFRVAHETSSYSFPAMVNALLPLMQERYASILTLTYLGSQRVKPSYNTMGLAKSSLEASVRYLAYSLGAEGIRVNAISAGPIRTLASSAVSGFDGMLKEDEERSPLRRNVTIEDVGNTAAFLLSDLAAGITGEITHVDGGAHIR